MKGLIKNRKGANDMIPFFVLIGAIVVVIILVAFANFFYTTETQPDDNGRFLDEDVVDRGDPLAIMAVDGYGTIKIELNEDAAPIAVANFISLCDSDFYDGLTFHRVIKNFMIQGGDPNGDGTGGPGYTIEGEADNGLLHDRGVIACAKKSGDTRMSGSQFYITHAEAHHLDGEHTVFGKVIEGMNVVDAIAETQTDSNDRPLNTVRMNDVYIIYQ